jgi:hypothetical protein
MHFGNIASLVKKDDDAPHHNAWYSHSPYLVDESFTGKQSRYYDEN